MSDMSFGSMREPVDIEELRRLGNAGAVFLDSRRSRPLWFDGRFLKAQDLNREQNYFLVRQGDLARAAGTGVAEGLLVKQSHIATRLVINSGYGVTVAGERVVVDRDMEIELANIPLIQRLNVVLGLSRTPAPSLNSRTGLFVVVLRALEFTANPIASYPTHVDAARSVEDGEIVEATAVTLVPYNLSLGVGDPQLRRAEAAYRIFASGGGFAAPQSSLPLALVEMEQGMVRWVDNFLVRREMGSAHSDVLGFGLSPRPAREAFLRQYLEMINDLIEQRKRMNAGFRFAASEQFLALPAAGRLPAAAIDLATGTQYFFPAGMDVEISFVPVDEIPLLVEESLVLPPIDLTAGEDVQEGTLILVLVPVERNELPAVLSSMPQERLNLHSPVTVPASRLRPVEMLDLVRTRLPGFVKPLPQPAVPLVEQQFREIAGRQTLLWYVRRRNLSYKAVVTGEAVKMMADGEFAMETVLLEKLKKLGVDSTYRTLKEKGSVAANLAMARTLSSERFANAESLLLNAVKELEKAPQLDEKTVYRVTESYMAGSVGIGLQKLEARVKEADTTVGGVVDPEITARNTERIVKIGDASLALELDSVASRLSPDELARFGRDVKRALDNPAAVATEKLTTLIQERNRRIAP